MDLNRFVETGDGLQIVNAENVDERAYEKTVNSFIKDCLNIIKSVEKEGGVM